MNKQYIYHKGYYGKFFPHKKEFCGEILNTLNTVCFDGKDEEDLRTTFFQGTDQYAEDFKIEKEYHGIPVQNLIAELALCITDPSMPCQLKDGQLITGAYIEDGIIILDTGFKRQQDIKNILKED